jgi:hypothetical protein
MALHFACRWDGEMSIMTEKKMKGHVCLYESARPDSCARCQAEREVEDGHHRRLLGSASKGEFCQVIPLYRYGTGSIRVVYSCFII